MKIFFSILEPFIRKADADLLFCACGFDALVGACGRGSESLARLVPATFRAVARAIACVHPTPLYFYEGGYDGQTVRAGTESIIDGTADARTSLGYQRYLVDQRRYQVSAVEDGTETTETAASVEGRIRFFRKFHPLWF